MFYWFLCSHIPLMTQIWNFSDSLDWFGFKNVNQISHFHVAVALAVNLVGFSLTVGPLPCLWASDCVSKNVLWMYVKISVILCGWLYRIWYLLVEMPQESVFGHVVTVGCQSCHRQRLTMAAFTLVTWFASVTHALTAQSCLRTYTISADICHIIPASKNSAVLCVAVSIPWSIILSTIWLKSTELLWTQQLIGAELLGVNRRSCRNKVIQVSIVVAN